MLEPIFNKVLVVNSFMTEVPMYTNLPHEIVNWLAFRVKKNLRGFSQISKER